MINSHKLGLVFGGFAGLLHLLWVFLVAMGWAGPILAFVYRIHFIDFSFAVADFTFGNAVMLIVFTAVGGYAVGGVLGTLWNLSCKQEETKEDYVVDKGY